MALAAVCHALNLLLLLVQGAQGSVTNTTPGPGQLGRWCESSVISGNLTLSIETRSSVTVSNEDSSQLAALGQKVNGHLHRMICSLHLAVYIYGPKSRLPGLAKLEGDHSRVPTPPGDSDINSFRVLLL